MVPGMPCCDTHNQPFRKEVTNLISTTSVQGSPVEEDLIHFWFARAWCWAASNACTHQLADPSPICQRDHVCNWPRVSKQGKTSKKTSYLQVFRLTWSVWMHWVGEGWHWALHQQIQAGGDSHQGEQCVGEKVGSRRLFTPHVLVPASPGSHLGQVEQSPEARFSSS